MKQKAIFTLDQSQYPAEEFKGLLKEKNLHWVPLIDVGVSLNDHVGIDEGKKMDVFFLMNRVHPIVNMLGRYGQVKSTLWITYIQMHQIIGNYSLIVCTNWSHFQGFGLI